MYKHKTLIQIRFKDLDKLGHVNNANHLTYFELARMSYFRDVIGENINWSKNGLILAKATVDYKKPLLLEENIFVHTACTRIGTKSFDLSYLIMKEVRGEEVVYATGTTVMVCYDYEQQKTIEISDLWRSKMMEFEGI